MQKSTTAQFLIYITFVAYNPNGSWIAVNETKSLLIFAPCLLRALGIKAVAHSLTKEVRGLQADSPTEGNAQKQ
jgi:hypothetical protein